MATAADFTSSSVPPPATASELEIYTQFSNCDVPPDSGAVRAYKGFIRPFSDDATAIRVVRALDNGLPVLVDAGRLDVDGPDLPQLAIENLLLRMAVPLTVIALEFSDSRRPRTYLVEPAMVPRLSACEHLRLDKSITVSGVLLPALCVYSGNLLRFETNRSQLEQVLDQTATYLAKYLVWLRTRNVYRRTASGLQVIRQAKPGHSITAQEIARSADLVCRGYWPGQSAPSNPAEHLATIKPEDECWCWSGNRYGVCCRYRDQKRVREHQIADFIHKLMIAARSKINEN